MKRIVVVVVLSVLLFQPSRLNAENIDFAIERFCYPEELKSSRQSCECHSESAQPGIAPVGIPYLTIDCGYKELKAGNFSDILPLYTGTLDLSWNALDVVPLFASDSLRILNLMHNNVSSLTTKNFVKVSNLQELYLSWNSIQSIEWNAFDDLAHLRILDLSHNNIHALSLQIFKPLANLETLSLAWNRQLNQTDGIEELDFYQTFGVSPTLRILNLEACSLMNLSLPEKATALEMLNLRRNRLTRIPTRLPSTLKKLDVSENLMETLKPLDTWKLSSMEELYLEDMLRMVSVEADAFVGLRSLRKLSFQNSRRLISIDANVFGVNATRYPPLRTMIFRGTMLRGFNETMDPVFRFLTQLDFNGMPLHCDCELIWFKKPAFAGLETHGRCYRPSRLRGMLISAAHASDFSCNTWPQWLYGLIILGLIILCSGGIYLIVVGLQPHRSMGVTLRQQHGRRVGPGSPYARVTIEPNRQEHF